MNGILGKNILILPYNLFKNCYVDICLRIWKWKCLDNFNWINQKMQVWKDNWMKLFIHLNMIYFNCQCLFLNAPAGENKLLHLILILNLWSINTTCEEEQIKTNVMGLVLGMDWFFVLHLKVILWDCWVRKRIMENVWGEHDWICQRLGRIRW